MDTIIKGSKGAVSVLLHEHAPWAKTIDVNILTEKTSKAGLGEIVFYNFFNHTEKKIKKIGKQKTFSRMGYDSEKKSMIPMESENYKSRNLV